MVFFGPAVFNTYAYTLESNPLLPVIEIGLLLVFLVHIYKTVRMFLGEPERAAGRATRRRNRPGTPSRKTFASSTMIVSGLWLLVFIVIHVKAFGTAPSTSGRRAAAISIAWRWRTSPTR